MPLTIASWNVNSVRKRLDHLCRFLSETAVDVICLQETKVTNELFPVEPLEALGFTYQALVGMKSYNGVAVLSRLPLEDVHAEAWLKRDDCRHVSAKVRTSSGQPIEVHSLYVPAGGDDPDPKANPKFAHKLKFLDALAPWFEARQARTPWSVIAGDFNVAPLETDVWSHKRLKNVITHTPREINRLTKFQGAGNWTDALRRFVPEDQQAFTWWSYRASDWRAANKGRRLDHVWVSETLTPMLSHAAIHKETRDWETPSDHVPVRIVLETT